MAHGAEREVAYSFETELARLVAELPGLEHHERTEYQDRLELLRQRQGLLGNSVATLAMTVKALCAGATVFALMILVHPAMLALAVLALPSVLVARTEQRWRRTAEEESATAGRTARHLRALAYDRDAGMEIRVFGLADEIDARAARAWDDHRRPLERAQRRVSLVTFAREAVYVAGVVVAIGFVLWRAVRGWTEPADVVLAIYLSQQVQAAVIWPIQAVAGLGQTLRTGGRFLWLRDHATALAASRSGGAPAPKALTAGIVLDDVSFRYPGSDSWVLRHVSLTIPAGCVIALVGENGAGKTTLVKLLTRMYEPTQGRILIDGVDLADIDVDGWRQRLSAAFQDFAALEFIARHTVGVGDLARLDDERRVLDALDRAGATDVASALPARTATQLGVRWGGVDLSGGQWQKLALSRALMRHDRSWCSSMSPPRLSTHHHRARAVRAVRRGGPWRGRARDGHNPCVAPVLHRRRGRPYRRPGRSNGRRVRHPRRTDGRRRPVRGAVPAARRLLPRLSTRPPAGWSRSARFCSRGARIGASRSTTCSGPSPLAAARPRRPAGRVHLPAPGRGRMPPWPLRRAARARPAPAGRTAQAAGIDDLAGPRRRGARLE